VVVIVELPIMQKLLNILIKIDSTILSVMNSDIGLKTLNGLVISTKTY
jgi:hypothetical protein